MATVALSYWVISSELEAQRHGYKYQSNDSLSAPNYDPQNGAIWVNIFSYYCLLIHFLVFCFPLRSCYAVFTIGRQLRKSARARTLKDIKFGHRRRSSSTSLSSSETLTSSRDLGSSSSSEVEDVDTDCYIDADIAPDRVIHAIVIPNYKEENDTLRETLEVLASHPQARNTYDVSWRALHFSRRMIHPLINRCQQMLVCSLAAAVVGVNGSDEGPPLFSAELTVHDPGLSCYGAAGTQCRDQGFPVRQ